jgi:UDP-N-acetylglucosamine--N-acetylmuramyl-(pentapeptide) pyrophosphoryl-undecaprenol N-acetylglucosamine transferase
VGRAGYRFVSVGVRGWAGAGLKGKLLFVFFMVYSILPALAAVLKERPEVVIGTGSYATLPFALSAAIAGIPIVLLEQNVVPGRATRFLSTFAQEVHVAYRETLRYLSRRTTGTVSGNPTRALDTGATRERALAEFRLRPGCRTALVFGGSRGAHSLNAAFASGASILSRRDDIQFIVQTGEDDLEAVAESCRSTGLNAFVVSFIHEMDKAYACADIVVCRAGATTIAELTALGLASILVPYPFSTGGHQEKNARFLEERGASVVLKDSDLTGELLASRITELLDDDDRRERMHKAAASLGRKDAALLVAQSVLRRGKVNCSRR